jgi:hypothetical protein
MLTIQTATFVTFSDLFSGDNKAVGEAVAAEYDAHLTWGDASLTMTDIEYVLEVVAELGWQSPSLTAGSKRVCVLLRWAMDHGVKYLDFEN